MVTSCLTTLNFIVKIRIFVELDNVMKKKNTQTFTGISDHQKFLELK